jgi:Ni/Co efflux regulator RcnB
MKVQTFVLAAMLLASPMFAQQAQTPLQRERAREQQAQQQRDKQAEQAREKQQQQDHQKEQEREQKEKKNPINCTGPNGFIRPC